MIIRRRLLVFFAVLVFYLLHQDFWWWLSPRPLVFGFLPAGLFYHAVYTLAAALLMYGLVRLAWPADLDGPETRP